MSNLFDLNEAEPQRGRNEPIPPDVYCLRVKVKDAGVNNVLHLAKNLRTSHLKLEDTIVGGEYDGYRIFDYVTLDFDDTEYTDIDDPPPITPQQADNYRTAVRRGRSRLKAIVDSAYGLDPNDMSEKAKATRREISDDLTRLDGLVFWAQVEIRKGSDGYGDSNCVDFIIVPGDPAYPQQQGGGLALRPSDPEDEVPY
jgi:hypothetical protein